MMDDIVERLRVKGGNEPCDILQQVTVTLRPN